MKKPGRPPKNPVEQSMSLEPHPADSNPELINQGWADQGQERVQVNPAQSGIQPERGRSGNGREDLRAAASKARKSGNRLPLGGHHLKLSLKDYADQLEGYVPRWVKDDGVRLQRALEGGYIPIYRDSAIIAGDGEDINTDLGTWVSQVTGRDEAGKPQRSYAMKLRKEWYDADQAEKQRPVDEVEQAIKNGQFKQEADDGRYVPQSRGIKLETNRQK